MPISQDFIALAPRWLAVPGRRWMGVSFLCPTHGGHRLRLWFQNPMDGGAPLERPRLAQEPFRALYRVVTADGFGGLTVGLPGREAEALVLAPHWVGWIIDGCAWSASFW